MSSCLLKACPLLKFGKDYVDQVQRHILAGTGLQASDDRNKLRAHGEKIGRGVCQKSAAQLQHEGGLCGIFSETSNESIVFFMFHLVQWEWGMSCGVRHLLTCSVPAPRHRSHFLPPFLLTLVIVLKSSIRFWATCASSALTVTHRSHRSDFEAAISN